jgi:nucleoid-associated protein YgaU
MSQGRIRQRAFVLLATVSVIALFAAGCDSSKKIESLQKDTQNLNQRVAELEDQSQQKDAALSAQAAAVQPPVGQPVHLIPAPTPAEKPSVYTVSEGDNLWGIAKKQLGSGTRYKEILALNPTITKDKTLAIGTKLIMPPR